jgi:hypothetical protein
MEQLFTRQARSINPNIFKKSWLLLLSLSKALKNKAQPVLVTDSILFPHLHTQITVINKITQPLFSLGAGLFLLIKISLRK